MMSKINIGSIKDCLIVLFKELKSQHAHRLWLKEIKGRKHKPLNQIKVCLDARYDD